MRPVGISTTSGETSPTTICALAAASASLRAGATGHRPRGRHEDASRLPGCRRRARQAVVLEGIGAAFEQAGRVLAQRRVGIRPRPAEAQRVRQASGPREHARPLRTPPSGELIRRRMRREADRSRRAVRQQQRLDAPTRTIVCTEPPSSGRLADTGWLSSNARCTHAATVRPGAVAPWRATTLRGPHWADATQVGRILPRELGIRDAQRVALQRRVAAYLVVGGLEVAKFPFKITGIPKTAHGREILAWSVISRRGIRPWVFSSVRKNRTAARRFRCDGTRMSRTSPSSSTARHRYCWRPWIVTNTSSRCQVSPSRPRRRRSRRA